MNALQQATITNTQTILEGMGFHDARVNSLGYSTGSVDFAMDRMVRVDHPEYGTSWNRISYEARVGSDGRIAYGEVRGFWNDSSREIAELLQWVIEDALQTMNPFFVPFAKENEGQDGDETNQPTDTGYGRHILVVHRTDIGMTNVWDVDTQDWIAITDLGIEDALGLPMLDGFDPDIISFIEHGSTAAEVDWALDEDWLMIFDVVMTGAVAQMRECLRDYCESILEDPGAWGDVAVMNAAEIIDCWVDISPDPRDLIAHMRDLGVYDAGDLSMDLWGVYRS